MTEIRRYEVWHEELVPADDGAWVLFDEVSALLGATGWQPIATAPQDGTLVIVAHVGPGGKHAGALVDSARWHKGAFRKGSSKLLDPWAWMPIRPIPTFEAENDQL